MIPVKTTLLVNGISSGITGILLTLLAEPVATLFNVGYPAVFTETGIFLLLFSLLVTGNALRKQVQPRWVKIISTLDVLWVLASVVVLLAVGGSLSSWGVIITAGVAAWVGLMAYLQMNGLKWLNP